tara:strand:- start:77 stop:871 length:795 start_codon:yes stop_codon:yes gene_type:complete
LTKTNFPRKVIKILTIAGSDNSAGAGIQGDLKTIHALGGYCSTAITTVTCQNSKKIYKIFNIPKNVIVSQIKTIFNDFGFDAVKIGIIPTLTLAESLFSFFKKIKVPIIVDPIYRSSSGEEFISKKEFIKVQKVLLKFSTVFTPNVFEAEIIAKIKIKSLLDMERAAKKILNKNFCSILIKDFKISKNSSLDILLENNKFYKFSYTKIKSLNTHGTGCALSSAIAFHLGKGNKLVNSIKRSKEYVSKAIVNSPNISKKNGPMGH